MLLMHLRKSMEIKIQYISSRDSEYQNSMAACIAMVINAMKLPKEFFERSGKHNGTAPVC